MVFNISKGIFILCVGGLLSWLLYEIVTMVSSELPAYSLAFHYLLASLGLSLEKPAYPRSTVIKKIIVVAYLIVATVLNFAMGMTLGSSWGHVYYIVPNALVAIVAIFSVRGVLNSNL